MAARPSDQRQRTVESHLRRYQQNLLGQPGDAAADALACRHAIPARCRLREVAGLAGANKLAATVADGQRDQRTNDRSLELAWETLLVVFDQIR
jgi:hypothetical protein